MCTVIILKGALPGYPLVIAANRDEMLDRPWSGPRALGQHPIIFAPRDETAGGTWIGINSAGLVAAITNRLWRADGEPPSRGLLCERALGCATVAEARAVLAAELAVSRYHGFNLLVADRVTAFLLQNGAGGSEVQEIEDGAHLLTSLHDLNPHLLAELRAVVAAAATTSPDLAGLEPVLVRVLSDHRQFDPLYSVCKHTEVYGTRSASLIALAQEGGAVFSFGPGRPCEVPWTPLLLPFGEVTP